MVRMKTEWTKINISLHSMWNSITVFKKQNKCISYLVTDIIIAAGPVCGFVLTYKACFRYPQYYLLLLWGWERKSIPESRFRPQMGCWWWNQNISFTLTVGHLLQTNLKLNVELLTKILNISAKEVMWQPVFACISVWLLAKWLKMLRTNFNYIFRNCWWAKEEPIQFWGFFFFHVLEPLSFNCKANFYVEATCYTYIR